VTGRPADVGTRSARPAGVGTWSALFAIGWAVGNVAGWTLGVHVGGTITGLVVAVLLDAVGHRAGPARPALVLVLAITACVLARLAFGERHTVAGLAVMLAAGLTVALAASAVLRTDASARRLVALTAAWGCAWVGSWFLTTRLLTAHSVVAAVAVEIVVAFAAGGVATGWLLGTAHPLRSAGLRWTAAGGIGLAVAWAVVGVVRTIDAGVGPSTDALLAAATTATLAIAATVAARPLLARAAASIGSPG
jgi:hypothetical protein